MKNIKIWLLLFLFVFSIFLTLNRHSRSGIQNYHSEIWADKAGYYIYLPALFIYNFNFEQLPPNIDIKTGNGFLISEGKLKTKYSYGVALMQSPFFLIAHGLAKLFGYSTDGFSIPYHKAINISAIFYSLFAFIFLYFFLIKYISSQSAFYTLIILFLGTNIFYYSIFDTGMSHIYSFFLFASFLLLGRILSKENQGVLYFLLFGLVIGLIIMVRPINIIFLPTFFIFNSISFSKFKTNFYKWFMAFLMSLLVVLPQLIYWKYAYGKYLMYSYQGEGFSYLSEPKFFELWFSTNNGLFVFNPIFIFVIIGFWFLYKKWPRMSIMIGAYFLFISYIFSSWHCWSYGCSYGSRPFVEYYALFSLPLSFVVNKLVNNNRLMYFSLFLFAIFTIYNLKLIFSYDGCWYGANWDWASLIQLLTGSTK